MSFDWVLLLAVAAIGLGIAVLVFSVCPGLRRRPRDQDDRIRQGLALLEHIAEGLVITDPEQRILRVNRKFTEITGYSADEVLDRTPSLLKSGRHDAVFYRELWETIHREGVWKGEIWNRRKNGEFYAEWLNIAAVKDDSGRIVNYIGTFSDITWMKNATQRLEHLAHHHPLTGLPNRLLLMARLEHALEQAYRYGTRVAVVFIDLDDFKQVNDTLGHASGDRVLQAAAKRLNHALRHEDTVAHVGGDEFVALIEKLHDRQVAAKVAEKLAASLKPPFEEGGRRFLLRASIGISLYPDDGESPELLIRLADQAMYQAKSSGGGNLCVYEPTAAKGPHDRA
ncbi:MAG: diguanylate cyclase [Pseudomonadota bacterium]|nr:diguanylate cyclase [Pseudomonadota bacterium]